MLAPFRLGVIAAAIRSSGISGPGDLYFGSVITQLHFDGASGSSTFTDTKGRTWTPSGGVALASGVQKFGTACVYFDGVDDKLSTAAAAEFSPGAGDFTYEFWVYRLRTVSTEVIFGARNNPTTVGNMVSLQNGYPAFSNGTVWLTSSIICALDAWTHVAVCRASGTLRIFVDGAKGYEAADATNYSGTTRVGFIGATEDNAAFFNGYIDDLRMTVGVARYTAAFTPPAAAFPDRQSSNLLLHFNGSTGSTTLTDSSPDLRTVTASGTAQLSTAQKKFGTASLALDGTAGCYATFPTPALSGDFTVEAWVYVTDSGFDREIFALPGIALLKYSGSNLTLKRSGVFTYGGSGVGVNAWHHVAVSRQGSSIRFFYDGALQGTVTDATSFASGTGYIGAFTDGSERWNGYIDEFRLVVGIALYTGAFTPPAAEFL